MSARHQPDPRDEAEAIIRRLRADAAFDFGVSVEWKRSGYDILTGALMYVLGIGPEDLAEAQRAEREIILEIS